MARIDSISKTFEPAAAEARIYSDWQEKGHFTARPDPRKKPYTIVIPPPNITGQLHMGHALDNTLQDILIRQKRMQGYAALWLPGTDHASIATEAKIVEKMREAGEDKETIGREAFLERAWEWKRVYGGRIIEQLKRLGSSCDWSRERFTMDDVLSDAVMEVFIRLYEKGLIYRGERIINWCPTCLTSISDAEVEYEETQGMFYRIRYPLSDGSGGLELATTRPETLLGDTAVAVHPDDERYQHLIGKSVILPIVNKEIPIIADTYVEREFGTGVVKITPAHDPNDFEVGLRHHLPMVNVLTEDAHIDPSIPVYGGMDRYEARRKIVEDLKAAGYLIRTEPHKHNVGACYRCSTTVEPRVSLQWFVKMKPLADPAIEVVREGKTRFVPERFDKTYFNWMENIRDWCISRQLWWGHRIPAYYCQSCGYMAVDREMPDVCPVCGSTRFKQDEDTLDTWFSSALWPFSTLGWPADTEDMRFFYPTSVLVTGYDIIFFWVARMIFSGLEHTGQTPFHTVFIHGIVRDEQGRKMSKSLGNGIDPLEIIDTFGADALRYALVTGNAPGNDLRFSTEKIEAGRNFINKIWNAFRFTVMNFDDDMDFSSVQPEELAPEDRWILSRLHTVIDEVSRNLDHYDLGIALTKIYQFLWESFCDWYIELAKTRLRETGSRERLVAQSVLNEVLSTSMKLLHPFMPFVTEEIYGHLIHDEEALIVAPWPVARPERRDESAERQMEVLMEAIRGIRNIRTQMNVPVQRRHGILVVSNDESVRQQLADSLPFLSRLAFVTSVETRATREGIPETAATTVFPGGELFILLEDLIDLKQETERLRKEMAGLEQELSRVRAKLDNPDFTGRAPEKVVRAEREKAARYEQMYVNLGERLKQLGG